MPANQQNISIDDIKSSFFNTVDVNYSNIDFCVDLFFSTQERNSFLTNKQRFQFPKTDIPISDYVDKRSDVDKFRDILQIVNSKLEPDMAKLWSEVCQYDIRSPCYYKSGMEIGTAQMRDLAKEYKLKNPTIKNNLCNMPDVLKKMKHSKFCPSSGKKFNEDDKCNYASSATEKCICCPSLQEKSDSSLETKYVENSNMTAALNAQTMEKSPLMSTEAKILLEKCQINGDKLKDNIFALECINYLTNDGMNMTRNFNKVKKLILKGKQLSKKLRKFIM